MYFSVDFSKAFAAVNCALLFSLNSGSLWYCHMEMNWMRCVDAWVENQIGGSTSDSHLNRFVSSIPRVNPIFSIRLLLPPFFTCKQMLFYLPAHTHTCSTDTKRNIKNIRIFNSIVARLFARFYYWGNETGCSIEYWLLPRINKQNAQGCWLKNTWKLI